MVRVVLVGLEVMPVTRVPLATPVTQVQMVLVELVELVVMRVMRVILDRQVMLAVAEAEAAALEAQVMLRRPVAEAPEFQELLVILETSRVLLTVLEGEVDWVPFSKEEQEVQVMQGHQAT